MRYEARVTAFDVLDQVHVAVVVYGPELEGSIGQEVVMSTSVAAQGTGESNPRQWTIDALVALLEVL